MLSFVFKGINKIQSSTGKVNFLRPNESPKIFLRPHRKQFGSLLATTQRNTFSKVMPNETMVSKVPVVIKLFEGIVAREQSLIFHCFNIMFLK